VQPDINTTGGLLPARGYDGQISRALPATSIDNLVNSGATRIAPAQCVGRDPTNAKLLRLALVGDALLGLVVRDPAVRRADADGTIGFAQYQSTPFMRLGYMNATPVEEVFPDDGVVAIFEDGVFSGLGGTSGGLTSVRRLLPGYKWETHTQANASEPGEVSAFGQNSVNYVVYGA